MRTVAFTPTALAQFNEWAEIDTKIRKKIIELLQTIVLDPFKGIGKPETERRKQ